MSNDFGHEFETIMDREATERLLEQLRQHHPTAETSKGWRSMDRPLPMVERPKPEPAKAVPPDTGEFRSRAVIPLRHEVREAIAYIAAAHDTSVSDIMSESRRRTATRARHEAFALLRSANYSYSTIGVVFHRDHSTVIAGIRSHMARQQREANRGAG